MATDTQGWRAAVQDPRFMMTAIRLAMAAAMMRFIVRDIESRWQILALCAGIVAFEFVTIRGLRSFSRAAILCGVCASSILTVKLATEPRVVPLAIWTAKADIKHFRRDVSETIKSEPDGRRH